MGVELSYRVDETIKSKTAGSVKSSTQIYELIPITKMIGLLPVSL